jgi:threonylcarbamoyladenosine tRNA methylthiotransferase MtaB
MSHLKITPLNAVYNSGRSRSFIKIQDGCDKKCTYCVIPSIRGASRSLSARDIIDTIATHVDMGADEIVLTGVRIGSWGRDLDPKDSLSDLVTYIRDYTNLERIRLGSLEPWELNENLADLIVNDRRSYACAITTYTPCGFETYGKTKS